MRYSVNLYIILQRKKQPANVFLFVEKTPKVAFLLVRTRTPNDGGGV